MMSEADRDTKWNYFPNFEDDEFDSNLNPSQPLTIHNVLAAGECGCEMSLDDICHHFGNSEYDPEEFQNLRIKIKCPDRYVSVFLFANGKISTTGANTIELAERSMQKVIKRLQKLGFRAHLSNFHVHNLFCVYKCEYSIQLNKLFNHYRGVDYEPERSPAALIRVTIPDEKTFVNDNKSKSAWVKNDDNQTSLSKSFTPQKSEVITLEVFSTGKITILGARSVDSINYAIKSVEPYLSLCKSANNQILG